jgi:hypothetical protein
MLNVDDDEIWNLLSFIQPNSEYLDEVILDKYFPDYEKLPPRVSHAITNMQFEQ